MVVRALRLGVFCGILCLAFEVVIMVWWSLLDTLAAILKATASGYSGAFGLYTLRLRRLPHASR